MADSEDNDLREKNNEMVKAIQHWKMTAAQKENEKLELMKEVNEWRLNFSRLKNAELAHAKKLNADLQTASEGALSHLVQASSFVARMLELTKTYMQGRQEIESVLPRWSSLSNTPTNEKVNRVKPLLIGGRHIQPVVSLSRTWQPSDSRTMLNRSLPQNNGNVSARAVPMHMLQVPFIPLTRIDAELPLSNVEVNVEDNDSTEDSASDDSSDSDEDDSEESQRLEAVPEEMESEDETPQRPIENPLEGPSWLLDVPPRNTKRTSKNLTKSEPDSTTELQDNAPSPGTSRSQLQVERPLSVTVACEFTPTVRRRRRASPPRALTSRNTARAALSPHFSPRPARRNSNSGRILKVMVAKMRLSDDDSDDSDASPPKKPKLAETPPNMNEQRPNHTEIPHKRPNVGETQPKPQKIFQRRSPESPKSRESSSTKRPSNDRSPILCPVRETTPSQRLTRFDAPSPNGSTDACVIVLEARNDQPEPCCSGISQTRRLSRANSRETQPKRSNHAPSNSNSNHPNSNHNHTTQQHSNHDNRRTKTRENQPNHGHNNHSDNSDNNHDTHPNSRDNRRTKTKDNQPNHANNNHSDTSDNNHDTHPNSRDKHGNHDSRRTKTKDNVSNNNSDSDNNHDNHRDNHSNGNHSSCDQHNHTSNMTNFVGDNHNKRSNRRRLNSHNDNESDSSNSDAIGERARRPRKAVVYKEKPLNRKLRR